jgi:hypothetical protein
VPCRSPCRMIGRWKAEEWQPYYDRSGRPISLHEWARLLETPGYKIIRQTLVGKLVVSTVWLGLDHNAFGGRPLIFETMFMSRDLYPHVAFGLLQLGPEFEDFQERYHSEEVARRRHEQIVGQLQILSALAQIRETRTARGRSSSGRR